jgi:hypothetical protein
MASASAPVIRGRPAVLYLPLSGLTLPGEGSTPAAVFISNLREQYLPEIVNEFVGLPAGTGPNAVNGIGFGTGPGHQAQFAIAGALRLVVKLHLQQRPGGRLPPGAVAAPPGGIASQQAAAARRFAAQPPAVRHAWLASHLAALRAGRVTLSEIP